MFHPLIDETSLIKRSYGGKHFPAPLDVKSNNVFISNRRHVVPSLDLEILSCYTIFMYSLEVLLGVLTGAN